MFDIARALENAWVSPEHLVTTPSIEGAMVAMLELPSTNKLSMFY